MNLSNIEHNDLDDLQYHELYADSKLLQSYSRQGSALIPHFDALMKDIFLLLYKMSLRLVPSEPSLDFSYYFLRALKEAPRVGKLRGRTKGKASVSYIAMKLVIDSLLESARGKVDLKALGSSIEALETAKDRLFYAQALMYLQSHKTSDILSADELKRVNAVRGRDDIPLQIDSATNTLLKELLKYAFAPQVDRGPSKGEAMIRKALSNRKPKDGQKAITDALEALEDMGIEDLEFPDSEPRAIGDIDSPQAPDESWRFELKRDFTQRLSPFLKGQFLQIAERPVTQPQLQSPLSSAAGVDEAVIASGSQGLQESRPPAAMDTSRLEKGAEEILRASRTSGDSPTSRTRDLSPAYDLEALRTQAGKTSQEIDTSIQALNLDQIISDSVSAIDAFTESTRTLGIDEQSMDSMSFDEVISMQKRFRNPKFLRFINQVGRNRLYARKLQYRKRRQSALPIEKVVASHHLDLMVDDEYISLALDIEAFENDFYDRFLQDHLLTFELVAERDRRKGPIILCYDGSGSMEGRKIEETQAHIISIMEIARIQKRRLVLIQFASRTEPLYIKTVNPLYIRAQDILDILDTFICGGTDFEKPLSKAAEFIAADSRKKSDILFITDGQCEISETFKKEFMNLKRERQFKLYTIIMHAHTYHDYGDIGDISDEILDIQDQNVYRWNEATNKKLYTLI